MRLLLFALIIFQTFFGFTKDIPDDFQLFVKLDRPTWFKRNLPNDLMFNNSRSYLAVNFGYKPAHVIVYDTENFDIVRVFKLRRFVYFATSYFGTISNGNIYLDNGTQRKRYWEGNLKTGELKKIDCEDAPNGCEYSNLYEIDYENDPDEGAMYFKTKKFIIKIFAAYFEIYVRSES